MAAKIRLKKGDVLEREKLSFKNMSPPCLIYMIKQRGIFNK